MGSCISYICNLFKCNKNINNIESENKPNQIKNSKLTSIKLYNIEDKNNYIQLIIDNFNNKIEITEDKYIIIRKYLNNIKKYKYIKTKKFIEYKPAVIEYKCDLVNIDKTFDNIIICENEDDLYTMPSSPYMSYKILYEPDFTYNQIKKKEFIIGLNNIIGNLAEIIRKKRLIL